MYVLRIISLNVITSGWHNFYFFAKSIFVSRPFYPVHVYSCTEYIYMVIMQSFLTSVKGNIAQQAIRMSEYHKKLQEEKWTYPVFMHCRPSAHLGESLDNIALVHNSPSFLSFWHFPPSNTWTKQKRPALHWLSSSHGEPARPECSEKNRKHSIKSKIRIY